jgi:A/G-specific adenine glycosylase
MAQQTRLRAVAPYFERFVARFPDVERLAAAALDDVLAAWSGLGYYSRARNLHASARRICADMGGSLPADPELLASLPGIGRYTAGAIASIAFQVPTPVVDGNVTRVLARLFDLDQDVGRPATQRRLWALAASLVPKERPGDFNESLMELGALVCTPLGPDCDACPLTRVCLARRHATASQRPVSQPQTPPRRIDVLAAAVFGAAGRLLLVKNPPHGLFGGLWTLPLLPRDGRRSVVRSQTRQAALFAQALGVEVRLGKRIAQLEHVLTHRRLRIGIISCELGPGRLSPADYCGHRWLEHPAGLTGLGVARLTRRLVAALEFPSGKAETKKGRSP